MAYTQPTHWAEAIGKAKTGRFQSTPYANIGPEMKVKADRKTVDAAQNDTIGLFEVPTSAILSFSASKLFFGALGASVVGHVGFADDAALGISGKTQTLAASVNMTNAGSAILVAALAATTAGKPIWELIGLAKDPKATVLVILTLAGADPASGTIAFEQGYFGA